MTRMSYAEAQKWIATTWFSFAGLLILILVALSVTGRFGDKTEAAWSWLVPTFVPTLGLIIGVLVTQQLGKAKRPRYADRFLFRLVWLASIFYLVLLAASLLLFPLAQNVSPLEFLEQSSLWLVPIQGVVSAGLGAFFVAADDG